MLFRYLWEILKYNGDRYLLVYQLVLHYMFIFRPKVNFFHLYILTTEFPGWNATYIFTTEPPRRKQDGKKSLWPRTACITECPSIRNSFFGTTLREDSQQCLSERGILQNAVIFARKVWVLGPHTVIYPQDHDVSVSCGASFCLLSLHVPRSEDPRDNKPIVISSEKQSDHICLYHLLTNPLDLLSVAFSKEA